MFFSSKILKENLSLIIDNKPLFLNYNLFKSAICFSIAVFDVKNDERYCLLIVIIV